MVRGKFAKIIFWGGDNCESYTLYNLHKKGIHSQVSLSVAKLDSLRGEGDNTRSLKAGNPIECNSAGPRKKTSSAKRSASTDMFPSKIRRAKRSTAENFRRIPPQLSLQPSRLTDLNISAGCLKYAIRYSLFGMCFTGAKGSPVARIVVFTTPFCTTGMGLPQCGKSGMHFALLFIVEQSNIVNQVHDECCGQMTQTCWFCLRVVNTLDSGIS